MNDYKKLKIYQEAYSLTRDIYALTRNWPSKETYVLTTQVRRSAHSVNTNVCEGASRGSKADCLRFIYNAYASLQETENHLQLAADLGYINEAEHNNYKERIDHISRMISNFIDHLRA